MDAKQLFELMPEGVAILDRSGFYVYVNPSASRMMGRPSAELVGKSIWDVYPDVRDSEWASALERVMAGGGAEFCEMHYAPSDRWTLIGTYPVGQEVVVVWRDVSDLKRTQRDLEKSLDEQRQLEKLRERLLGIVGHDLRMPLTAITTAAEGLMRRESLSSSDALVVSPIVRSAKRMARMISQILDFTRARLGGGFHIEPATTDFVEVCREVIAECAQANPERQISFRASDQVIGLWDRDRLCEVVSNLLGNALQHGSPDQPVELELTSSPEEAVLRVRNQGEPIPPDVLPYVFDPFRRARSTSEATKPDSVGLGLYITKEIVTSHHGRLDVESNRTATIFSVRLPRALGRS